MNIILGCQQQFEAVITEVLSGKDHCRLIFMPFSHSLLLIMLKPMPYFVKRRNVKLWSWRPWSITCYQSAGPPSRVPARSPESPRWGSCMLWVALIATKVEVLLILCKCHSVSFPYKNNPSTKQINDLLYKRWSSFPKKKKGIMLSQCLRKAIKTSQNLGSLLQVLLFHKINIYFRGHNYREIWPAHKFMDPSGKHEWATSSVWCGSHWRQTLHRGWERRTQNTEHGGVLWSKEKVLESHAPHVHPQARTGGGGPGGTDVCSRRTRRLVLPEHSGAMGPPGQAVELCCPNVHLKEHCRSCCADGKVCPQIISDSVEHGYSSTANMLIINSWLQCSFITTGIIMY